MKRDTPGKSGARILVVEDDARELQVIHKALAAEGYLVDPAPDGAKALTLLDKNEYDLLVTDLLMPKATGFDIIQELQRRKLNLPVVICSAHVTSEIQACIQLLPRVEIVRKPYKTETLVAAVQKLLA